MPRRTYCKVCGQKTRASSGLCRKHWLRKKTKQYGKTTKIKDVVGYRSRHRFQQVRNHAHRVAKYLLDAEEECAICGYSTYVELCHIKPISEFGDEVTLEVVNSADNLVWLCPNHHKELELGVIKRDWRRW